MLNLENFQEQILLSLWQGSGGRRQWHVIQSQGENTQTTLIQGEQCTVPNVCLRSCMSYGLHLNSETVSENIFQRFIKKIKHHI